MDVGRVDCGEFNGGTQPTLEQRQPFSIFDSIRESAKMTQQKTLHFCTFSPIAV